MLVIVYRTGSKDAWCQEARLTKTYRTLKLLSKRLLRRLGGKWRSRLKCPIRLRTFSFRVPTAFEPWPRTTVTVRLAHITSSQLSKSAFRTKRLLCELLVESLLRVVRGMKGMLVQITVGHEGMICVKRLERVRDKARGSFPLRTVS